MMISRAPVGLYVGSGNRCGHNPTQPNFLVQSHASNLPLFIQRSFQRVDEIYHRIVDALELDSLNECRKKRTERREAVVQALKVCLKYLDLVTLTICIPTDAGMVGLTLERLHKETTISWSRFKRAVADLRRAGWLVISQPRTTNRAGEVRGLVAIKALSSRLFKLLRLDLTLRREREKASKRQRVKASRQGKTQRAFYQRQRCATASAPVSAPVQPGHGQTFAEFVAARRRPL